MKSIDFIDYNRVTDSLDSVVSKLNYNNQLINEFLTLNSVLHREVINVPEDGITNFKLIDGHYDSTSQGSLKLELNGNKVTSEYVTYIDNQSFSIKNLALSKSDVLVAYYRPLEWVTPDEVKNVLSDVTSMRSSVSDLNSKYEAIQDSSVSELENGLKELNNLLPQLEKYSSDISSIKLSLDTKVTSSYVDNKSLFSLSNRDSSIDYLPDSYLKDSNSGDKNFILEYRTVDNSQEFTDPYTVLTSINKVSNQVHQLAFNNQKILSRSSMTKVDPSDATSITNDMSLQLQKYVDLHVPSNDVKDQSNQNYVLALIGQPSFTRYKNSTRFWVNPSRVSDDISNVERNASQSSNKDLNNLVTVLRSDINNLTIVTDDQTNRWNTWTHLSTGSSSYNNSSLLNPSSSSKWSNVDEITEPGAYSFNYDLSKGINNPSNVSYLSGINPNGTLIVSNSSTESNGQSILKVTQYYITDQSDVFEPKFLSRYQDTIGNWSDWKSLILDKSSVDTEIKDRVNNLTSQFPLFARKDGNLYQVNDQVIDFDNPLSIIPDGSLLTSTPLGITGITYDNKLNLTKITSSQSSSILGTQSVQLINLNQLNNGVDVYVRVNFVPTYQRLQGNLIVCSEKELSSQYGGMVPSSTIWIKVSDKSDTPDLFIPRSALNGSTLESYTVTNDSPSHVLGLNSLEMIPNTNSIEQLPSHLIRRITNTFDDYMKPIDTTKIRINLSIQRVSDTQIRVTTDLPKSLGMINVDERIPNSSSSDIKTSYLMYPSLMFYSK